jgi:hypothetical protein
MAILTLRHFKEMTKPKLSFKNALFLPQIIFKNFQTHAKKAAKAAFFI